MNELVHLVALPDDLWIYLAIDLLVVIFLLLVMRWLSGRTSKTSVQEELTVRDNFAFGISLAGRMLSLCIVLSEVVVRHIGEGYVLAAVSALLMGTVVLLLIKVGRYAHDKLVLNRLDKDALIADRNTSVALVDAASAVAMAIIIRSSLAWVEGSDQNSVMALLAVFAVVLVILLSTTRLYEKRFADTNQGSLQEALVAGQMALALEHSGHLLGTAIVVSVASHLLVFEPTGYVSNITGFLFVGFIAALSLAVLVAVIKRMVLYGLNWEKEVDCQHNVGLASIELGLSVGIALIFLGILTHW